MPTYTSSSVSPLFSNADIYDNYLPKAVLRAVLGDTSITSALVDANTNNPSRRQRVLYDEFDRRFSAYLPAAEETFTETRNPYGQVKAAFDYIVRTKTVLGGGSNAVTSSISPAQQYEREQLGDYSFSVLDPHTVYRTLNAPYRYNAHNRDSFEVGYVLPYVKIKQTLTRGEYVNQWVFKNRHDLHNDEEWGGADIAYPIDSNGNIVIDFGVSRPALLVPGYDARHVYTFMEYMVLVGSVGNLARGVFAYNHTVNNSRDSVIDNLLVETLRDSNGDPLTGKFYPVIPMRRNNVSTKAILSKELKEVFRNRYELDVDGYLDQLEKDPSIGNVDDCFMVHGVPLNSRKQSHKRYLFQFFRDYHDFSTNLKLEVVGQGLHTILQATTFGLSSEPYKAEAGEDVSISVFSGVTKLSRNTKDKSAYETISLVDFTHTTVIDYGTGTNTIAINAINALADQQYDEFMVPLHAPTVNKMSNPDKISLAGSNMYLVFNSIDHQVKGFWQSFLEVFLVGLAIASVLIPIVGQAAATGLGAVAVGGLGLTGATAVIIGSLINLAAAGVATELIKDIAGQAFGDAEGAVIGALVGVFIAGAISGKGGFAKQWQNLNGLTKGSRLTNALASVYEVVNEEELAKINSEFNALNDLYKADQEADKERNKKFEKGEGYYDIINGGGGQHNLYSEKPDAFIKRTTLVGSDLVTISLGSVNDFVAGSLKLPLID